MSTSPHGVGSGAANGITANVKSAGMKDIAGASMNRTLSAWAGRVSSLTRFLSPSAAGCNRPCGPTRFGPSRSCIHAQMRRSARVSSATRSEEHTSELQSQSNLVCRLLLEKKKKKLYTIMLRSKPVYLHAHLHYKIIAITQLR